MNLINTDDTNHPLTKGISFVKIFAIANFKPTSFVTYKIDGVTNNSGPGYSKAKV